ncbi:hypothetical protein NO2_1211 [Candidatus Termititenax persephonae]|uniref:Uncharacterized protein n=1 Tax=Candidatus Termititenax persephonae TaxID=2218525 RepID=A0A388TIS5_9BACT|nr:hypothetical protein NO2_1211 [Candidatus Termititenax persephonae]
MRKTICLLLGVVLAAAALFAQPETVDDGTTPSASAIFENVSGSMLDITYARVVEENETLKFYDMSLGLKSLRLRTDFARLDYRPDLAVAYHSWLYWFGVPIYYTPTLILDGRPNAYAIPSPLPEMGDTHFSGRYWQWNINYFWQDNLYGNLQFGSAQEKGAGYGFQQIVRFSDASQLTYLNQNWQYWPTQEEFSWEYSFSGVSSFNKMYADRIWNEFNLLRITRANYEEHNEELLMREFELSYIGNFKLRWQELDFYTNNSYASINELTSAQHGYRWASMSELYKECEVPLLDMFRPGGGYDTVKYSLRPYSWHRVYGYLEGQKEFWLLGGSFRVTDYIDRRGGSPFVYDQEADYDDNMRTTITADVLGLKLGQTVRYSIYRGKIYTLLYFLRLRTEHLLIEFGYNQTKDEFRVSGQMISF